MIEDSQKDTNEKLASAESDLAAAKATIATDQYTSSCCVCFARGRWVLTTHALLPWPVQHVLTRLHYRVAPYEGGSDDACALRLWAFCVLCCVAVLCSWLVTPSSLPRSI